jgi:trimeric autotransporter adhesin
MKTRIIAFVCCFLSLSVFAQEKMYIHKSDKMTLGALVSETDSIYFNDNETICYFRIGDTLAQYPVSSIDSINFGANSDTVFITYNGADVTVFNPLAFEGVSVTVSGSDVTVHSTDDMQDVNFCLAGATTNGMFKIYTSKRYNLIMNGVSITNPDGPAINVQTGKNTTVILNAGTLNNLTDGVTYASPPSGEDQKSAFFSESKLIFTGSGMLNINGHGSDQHGLCSDDRIEVISGVIAVNSAVRDGIHAQEGIVISGGTISVNSSNDGIDGDLGSVLISGGSVTTTSYIDDIKGILCDSSLVISGGIVDVTVAGDRSKGLECNQPMTLSGGTITIHNSGDAVLVPSGSGYDPSYSTAIRCGSDINISGAGITIVASGKAGRGISSQTGIYMSSGNIQITSTGNGGTYTNSSGHADAYVAECFRTEGNIQITGGTVTTSSSGSAGMGFACDNEMVFGELLTVPTINITTTGAKILISGSGQNAVYAEPRAVRVDTSLTVNNGNITISSSDDAIKTSKAITINAGSLTINNSTEGMEAPYITINGGTVHVHASDDGINSTFGFDGETDDNSLLNINGGWVVSNTTQGDGLDCNGDILITGGTVIIHGPQNAPEVGMDYNGTCDMNGGLLVISGTNSNMTQAPSNSSDQYCIKVMMNQSQNNSTLFHIQDNNANDILTFQPARTYYSIVYSSDQLQTGVAYSIYTGGTSTGTSTDGLYSGGTYSGGTFRKSFNITNTITTVNF